MINWNHLNNARQIDEIVERSKTVPCVIFKHSTRCPISSMAKYRLESDWDIDEKNLEAYFLDLIAHRKISNYISETFQVHHESPQALLIQDGECTFDTSHLDITVDELKSEINVPEKN